MSTLTYILIFTLLGSLASLAGGIVLLMREKLALSISHYLTAFAAGALLAAAFVDLLPEAIELSEGQPVLLWTMAGIVGFFLLERSIHWLHHHSYGSLEEQNAKKSVIPLVMIGDTVHNFIDGVAIALTFMVSIPLGMVTSLAVIAHEIPQEIGDFGVMLHFGMKRSQIIKFNIFSALAAVAGAVLAYVFGTAVSWLLVPFLSIAAGFFIYIAATDLIPEIHHQEKKQVALYQTIAFLFGVCVVTALIQLIAE